MSSWYDGMFTCLHITSCGIESRPCHLDILHLWSRCSCRSFGLNCYRSTNILKTVPYFQGICEFWEYKGEMSVERFPPNAVSLSYMGEIIWLISQTWDYTGFVNKYNWNCNQENIFFFSKHVIFILLNVKSRFSILITSSPCEGFEKVGVKKKWG